MSVYRSNLTPPDMSGFKLRADVVQNCGHDCPSDPDFEPDCTFWTHDELAILNGALQALPRKTVVDIGARFGWTAKAINAATGSVVICVDPILKFNTPFWVRFGDNLKDIYSRMIICPVTSQRFFLDAHLGSGGRKSQYSGFVIDGNHDTPEPLNDARGCESLAADDAIIILHDGRGQPVCDAAVWLLDNGFRVRFYTTPNGVFIAWRGFDGWEPPVHEPDPKLVEPIGRQMRGQMDMGRMS